MFSFIKHLPVKTMLKLILCWVVLVVFNYILIKSGLNPGTPVNFPISNLQDVSIRFFGLPYTVLFLIVFFLALKYSERLNMLQVWIAGLILIVLGNLAQGGVDAAFYKPFYETDYQYYHDAIQITNWRAWLSYFNTNQVELLAHSQTHPPFAVLLHYFLLNIGGNKLFILATPFILLSSLSIILVWQIMKSLGLSARQSSQLALLFTVIPAFNIYSAVSLDGIIAMFSTIFLLGMVKIVKRGMNLPGMFLFIGGILLTNLFTFGGIFLVATACLTATREIIIRKRYGILLALLVSLLAGILSYIAMLHYFAYDHVKAFLTASAIENPHGFRAFYIPLEYFMTRIENVAEIALFLSIGAFALFFHHHHLKLRIYDLHDDITSIFLAGVICLLLMFIAGAFKTGETARACLFIYPYLILALRNLQEHTLRSTIIVAGLQTIIMQTFGGFFW